MKRYIFRVTLSGDGNTPAEAWRDAVEGFTQDPGGIDEGMYDEVEDEV